jgi:hypothetical protein
MDGLTSFFFGFFFSLPRASLLPIVLLLVVSQKVGLLAAVGIVSN